MRLTVILLLASILCAQRLTAQTDSVKQVVDTTGIIHTGQNGCNPKYIKESIVPVGLAAGSLAIIAIPNLKENLQSKLNWNNQNTPQYINLGEDYVRYAPIAVAYTLSLCGLKSQHKFIDRTAILVVATVANNFVVFGTKSLTKETRPDRREKTSFPSAHTAMAFVAASFLDHELGYISPWISAGGYLTAGYVGYCRVARNAHFVNDVLMGAAVGMLVTNATYWAYDGVMKHFSKHLTLTPMIESQHTGIYACYKF